MSNNSKHRRSGSTSKRYTPSRLVSVEAVQPVGMGKAEVAACGAVVIIACALIVLIWIVAQRAVQDQQMEIRDRTEQALKGQAATIAETIGHELLLIDQSLTMIQAEWKADSDSVDLLKLQQTMPALTAVADDLFISDEKHVIRQDILPKAVGQGVGAAYVTFPHGSLEQLQGDGRRDKESLLIQGEIGQPIDARQFLMYVVRPLDHPKGWLIGASYRSEELPRLFADAGLGFNSVVALVDTKRGIVQAIVGPAARRPKVDLTNSQLLSLITRSDVGSWLGSTPIDDVQRLHAFHKVSDRDIAVVVAANWSEVMALARTLEAGARLVAVTGSGVVLLIAGLLLWELYAIRENRRRKRTLNRNKIELARLRTEETALAARALVNTARLKVVLSSVTDGIALLDANHRLVEWNQAFFRGIGIELKQDMPLDSMLRAQAVNGLFGELAEPEVEIARRAGMLRSYDAAGVVHPGPDGEILTLRGLFVAEGGLVLLLNGLRSWEATPAAVSPETEEPAAPEPVTSASIEW